MVEVVVLYTVGFVCVCVGFASTGSDDDNGMVATAAVWPALLLIALSIGIVEALRWLWGVAFERPASPEER